MANDGVADINPNVHPARLRTRASRSNRNNTSFKIPRNSMKINVKPNSNRNTNASKRHFDGRLARTTNHNSRIAPHHSPSITFDCHPVYPRTDA